MKFDLIIIGGGPIGIACGLKAKENGLSYLILEKGCIVNSLFNYPQNMQFFSSSERLEIGEVPFISNEAKPKKKEALEYYRRIVTSNQLNIKLFEKVNSVLKKEIFEVHTSKEVYKSKKIIIATGFYDYPNLLNIPGENLEKVSHYYDDPHYFANQEIAIVGASNSAVDAALECYRKGAKVTMIIRSGEISSHVKYWVKPDIENRIAEGCIKVYFQSELCEIRKDEIDILDSKKGKITLKNDFVLALNGYQPDFKFLKEMGVSLSKDEKKKPFYNQETMETNIEGLYLAGVVCGGMDTHLWFIENSRIHAKMIISHIATSGNL